MKWNQIELADENFLEQFTKDGLRSHDAVLMPKKLPPYHAYRTLKDSFGDPNSEMYDEMKSQWQFSLQSSEAFFEVYDWKIMSWSIALYLKDGIDRSAEDVGEDFLNLLENQANKYTSDVKNRLKNPDGLVIENPFMTYRETADSIYELILDLKDPKTGNDGNLDFSGWMKHYDLCRSAFIMYLSSVEGFINLIYELYLRKELREKRIYDRVCREQIDLKLRLAPIYCECFKPGVLDPDSDAFKKYHSLANLRNDFVHANLTKPMMNPVVYEDDIEFVIDVKSNTSVGIPSNFREIKTEHIEIAKEITSDLIEYIIESMELRFRRELEPVLEYEHIKVEVERGQLYLA